MLPLTSVKSFYGMVLAEPPDPQRLKGPGFSKSSLQPREGRSPFVGRNPYLICSL